MRRVLYSIALAGVMALTTAADSQVFKTALRVTVLDDLGNIQEGASVRLFATEADYKNEKNAILPEEKSTDKKGVIWFKDIAAASYWVLAEKGDKNNWGGGVKTDTLQAKKVNRINIIIE